MASARLCAALDELLADDRGGRDGQQRQKRGVRRRKHEPHGVRIDRLDLHVLAEVRRVRRGRLRIEQSLEAEHHVIGGELLAVVPHDALAQGEGVHLAVWRDLPLLGQVGDHAGSVRLVVDQAAVNHRADGVDRAGRTAGGGIELRRISVQRELEDAATFRLPRRRGRHDQGGHGGRAKTMQQRAPTDARTRMVGWHRGTPLLASPDPQATLHATTRGTISADRHGGVPARDAADSAARKVNHARFIVKDRRGSRLPMRRPKDEIAVLQSTGRASRISASAVHRG